MFLRNIKYLVFLFCAIFVIACGNDNDSDGDASAPIADYEVVGGTINPDLSLAGGNFAVDITDPDVTTVSLTFDLEEGSTYRATLDVEGSSTELLPSNENGNSVTFAVQPLSYFDQKTLLMTLVVTDSDEEEFSFVFDINRALPERDFDQEFAFATLSSLGLEQDDMLGYSMDYDGSRLVIGLPGYDGDFNGFQIVNSGAVAVAALTAEGWEVSLMEAPAGHVGARDSFGSSVAILGDFMLVGANGESGSAASTLDTPDNLARDAGAVYTYVYDAQQSTWVNVHYVKASTPADIALFGSAVDIIQMSETELQFAVTAPGANEVEVFTRTYTAAEGDTDATDTIGATPVTLSVTLTRSLDIALDLGERFLAIGQPGMDLDINPDDADGTETNVGQVTVFTRNREDGSFGSATFTIEGSEENGVLGSAVAIYEFFDNVQDAIEARLALGAPGQGDGGQVVTYVYQDDAWVEEAVIDGASNTFEGDRFGSSVALFENGLLVGATGNDGGPQTTLDTVINRADSTTFIDNSGAGYLWWLLDPTSEEDDAEWELLNYFKSAGASANDGLGRVALFGPDGSLFLSALRGEDVSGEDGDNTGAVYHY